MLLIQVKDKSKEMIACKEHLSYLILPVLLHPKYISLCPIALVAKLIGLETVVTFGANCTIKSH